MIRAKYTVVLKTLIDIGTDFGLKDYPIFDEEYREPLNMKILNHFKYREIGFETPGRFIDELNIKMNEIMPYYNQFYETLKLEYNPLHNVDYTVTHTTTRTGSTKQTSESKSNVDNTSNAEATTTTTSNDALSNESNLTKENNAKNVSSDTPSSLLTVNDIDSVEYASNITLNKDGSTEQTSNTSTSNGTTSGTSNSTTTDTSNAEAQMKGTSQTDDVEKFEQRLIGNYGVMSSQKLIQETRDLFINIDMMICEQLEDLFMKLW